MNHLTINIAYIAENQELINRMIRDLKSTEVTFNLIDGNSFVSGESFYSRLVEDNNPCLLMVSDNFLKSQPCLNQGLAYLQTLIKNEQILPIIIDGTEIDAAGNRQLIPTEFEKVSNVIRYMNFWQEKYLDLRKLKRRIPKEEEEAFSGKLKIVRGISSEVGEYLRNLRDTNYYPFSEFSANNYEAFFRVFGDEASHLKFVNTNSHKEEEGLVETKTTTVVTPMVNESAVDDPTTAIESKIEEVVAKEAPIPPAEPANNFLPFNDLVVEKEKIDNLSVEELDNGEAPSSVENDGKLDTPSEINSATPIENVEAAQQNDLIAMDPEWAQADIDGADFSEQEEEISLQELAASEERPLTETELLALELAQKLPTNENSEPKNNQLSLLEDTDEEEETQEEEEEMISLSDLMGDDLLIEENIEVVNNTTESQTVSPTEIAAVGTSIGAVALFTETNGSDNSTEEMVEEDEDELEGYFMDEGEETEEIEEELSELEVLQSANTLVHSGKIEDGISLLKDTLAEVPDFGSVRYQYAAFLAKYHNDFKEASNQLAILLEQEPNNLSAKFFLGELAEVERDYLTAKNYYEKVHHDNPEFPNVSYKLGMLLVHYLKDNPEAAAGYLKEAYQKDPGNINALYHFGLIKNDPLKKEVEAIAAFEEVLEKAPEHPFANYDLAVIYHKKGEREKALQFYEKSAEVNPELKTAVNDQAFAIASDVVEAKEKQNIKLVQIAESAEKEENYTISNLVANVHPIQEANRSTKVHQSILKTPSNTEISTVEKKEVVKIPKPQTKIALITGATSGIGKATAAKFAAEGYQLILTGRRFSRLFQIKDQFEKDFDAKVRLLPFDIKSSAAVKEALAELEEDWQAIDILVNNAGLAKGETAIHEGEISNWEEMIDTNLKGLLYVTREIAPFMVKRRKGQIINVCSLAGKEVYPNNAVYCATKHAVDALSKAMRVDLHKYNIRVSQVSPGYVEDTEFSSVKTGDTNQQITDFIPVNAQDVSEVIYFMTTQPNHVTLQEVVMTGTQQANANIIDRSGRS